MNRVRNRFWARVSMPADSSCWPWVGMKTEKGYGYLVVDGKKLKAHRLSWELENGPIQEGMCILHRCDNPGCVYPNHLFLGTNADNVADCVAKGRHAHSKLTAADVVQIRSFRATGHTQRAIAEEFGIDRTTVRAIERREIWRHVP